MTNSNNYKGKSYLAVIILGVMFFGLLRYHIPITDIFFRTADQDTLFLLQSLDQINSHTISYFDHPGFLPITIITLWLKLLKNLGFFDETFFNIQTQPSLTSLFFSLIIALRILSGMLCIFLLMIFFKLVNISNRKISLVSLIATTTLLMTRALFIHFLAYRSELIACLFALFSLILFLRSSLIKTNLIKLFVMIYISGLCFYFSLLSKVQALVLLGIAPILIALAKEGFKKKNAEELDFLKNKKAFWIPFMISSVLAIPGIEATSLILEPKFYHIIFILWLVYTCYLITSADSFYTRVQYTILNVLIWLNGFFSGFLLIFYSYHLRAHFAVLHPLDILSNYCEFGKCSNFNFKEFQEIFLKASLVFFEEIHIGIFSFDIDSLIYILGFSLLSLGLFLKVLKRDNFIRLFLLYLLSILTNILFRFRYALTPGLHIPVYYEIFCIIPVIIVSFICLKAFDEKKFRYLIQITLFLFFIFGFNSILVNLTRWTDGNFSFLPLRSRPIDICASNYAPSMFRTLAEKGWCSDDLSLDPMSNNLINPN